MQRFNEFLTSLYDIAPDAVVEEDHEGHLVIQTGLKINRSPDNDIQETFVHDLVA
jgi:hypothetical protein